jgi:hypothetical protein
LQDIILRTDALLVRGHAEGLVQLAGEVDLDAEPVRIAVALHDLRDGPDENFPVVSQNRDRVVVVEVQVVLAHF